MRTFLYPGLLFLTGCLPTQLLPDEPPTQQVASSPFSDGRKAMPTRVSYAPASHETAYRVELIRGKLVGENPQIGFRPIVTPIQAMEPEIFHVGLSQIYLTEGLVRQCQSDGQLAAVLANELGRMISEREATVSDQVRQPERLLPIDLPIGSNGMGIDRDPLKHIERARFEQQYPKHAKKLPPPNPQQVARSILERAGYERTELDAAAPILEAAQRYSALENQFKGTTKQGNWKAP